MAARGIAEDRLRPFQMRPQVVFLASDAPSRRGYGSRSPVRPIGPPRVASSNKPDLSAGDRRPWRSDELPALRPACDTVGGLPICETRQPRNLLRRIAAESDARSTGSPPRIRQSADRSSRPPRPTGRLSAPPAHASRRPPLDRPWRSRFPTFLVPRLPAVRRTSHPCSFWLSSNSTEENHILNIPKPVKSAVVKH